ncbi:DNA polymerase III subunit delta [Candidatus Saccharibacteria bacterium]|nr:DNA polymerase III subunit delta [Candidatus Saccharibacteria bacterium]
MITFLTGDNTFEIDRALRQQRAAFVGEVGTVEGEEITSPQFLAMLGTQTLFAAQRFVVLREPMVNKSLWAELPELLGAVDNTMQLVIVQPSPDKRTATYKWLSKNIETKVFTRWTERDTYMAEQWAMQEAASHGVTLDKKLVQLLVQRTGIDQWRIAAALEKLALAAQVDADTIALIVEASPGENIFSLLQTALSGTPQALQQKVRDIAQTEDAYKAMGLLGSQVFQLAAVKFAGSQAYIAKDLGISPYAVAKLSAQVRDLSRAQIRAIVHAVAVADTRLKTTDAQPWMIVEEALMYIQTASSAE